MVGNAIFDHKYTIFIARPRTQEFSISSIGLRSKLADGILKFFEIGHIAYPATLNHKDAKSYE